MLSKFTLRCFGIVVTIGSYAHSFHFEWDSKTLSLKMVSSQRRLRLYYLTTAYIFLLPIIISLHFLQACYSNHCTPTHVVFSIPNMLTIWLSAALHLNTVYRGEEVAKCVTKVLRHESLLTSKSNFFLSEDFLVKS
jgi:hypothetical protein